MNFAGLFNNKSKIVERDNINLEQWKTNVKFLNDLDEFTKEADDEWSKERANFVSTVTPILVKIGVNFYRDPDRIPDFLKNNLKDCVWFLAAYPDVIDYFYPTSELNESQKDRDELDEKCDRASKILGKFLNRFKNSPLNDIDAFLIGLKSFYIERGNNFLLGNI